MTGPAFELAHEFRRTPTATPALIALAVVAGVALAMVGVTFTVLKSTTDRTSSLVHNSVRSLVALNEIGDRVAQLETADGDARQIESQLVAKLAAYERVATYPGEAAELARFKAVLGRAVDPLGAKGRAARFEHLDASVERLRDINVAAVSHTSTQIEAAQWNALVAQVVAGLMTLVAAAIAAIVMCRVMRRQRELIEHYIVQLRERNRDLTAFAGRTAHDLRGPLAPIRGYADLIERGTPIDAARAAERIRRNSDRMTEIIETQLVLSTTGLPPPGEVDVAPLVRTVVAELSSRFVKTEIRSSLDDCRAACAPSVLEQVVHNVLDNASKYRSPERSLTVRIDAKQIDSQVEIAIEDNGLGMSPEVVAHAFDTHYRAPDASASGSGLGLSIVKQLVEAVGGTCEITSEVGRGTRVVIRVPAA